MSSVDNLTPQVKAAIWKGWACADAVVQSMLEGENPNDLAAIEQALTKDQQRDWTLILGGYVFRLCEHIFERELRLRELGSGGTGLSKRIDDASH